MRKGGVYSAVLGIIENEKGEILFQRRQNSGFADGLLQIPAGHIEGEELCKDAFIREMKEEINIDINEKDIEIKHISHRIKKNDRVYFDVYLKVNKYSGEIKNNEPYKCSELKFIDLDNYNEKEMIGFDVEVIKLIKAGKQISEFVF